MAFSKFCSLTMLLAGLVGSTSAADESVEINKIVQAATKAQTAEDYQTAIGLWEQLIEEHAKSDHFRIALFNAGRCYLAEEKFQQATDRLQRALNQSNPNDSDLGENYLLLGFSQREWGRSLASESAEQSQQWLTTSAHTFSLLAARLPDFEHLDQAHYFQAGAFESLQRLSEAAEAYRKVLAFEDPKFRLDALFGLASIFSLQGKYDEALALYQQFISSGTEHKAITQASFLAAESQVQLAVAAQMRGETEQSKSLMSTALEMYQTVFNAADPEWSIKAKFEQAHILSHQRQWKQSAQAYQAVAEDGGELADRAAVLAGRDFLRARDANAANRILSIAVEQNSSDSAEAAHWLAQLYLRSGQHEQAYKLATRWIEEAESTAVKVDLMFDQADAALAIARLREQTPDLYLKIANRFPDEPSAAYAIYNAAFAALETGQFTEAIDLVSRFEKDHSDSEYLPDALEVKADSSLFSDNLAIAQKVLNRLISDFEDHPKKPLWQLRYGHTLYLQKSYQQAIDWLEPIVDSIDSANGQAEAWHWIGCSQQHLGQHAGAIESLRRSTAIGLNWPRADQTLLALSHALHANEQDETAKSVAERLVEQYHNSNFLPDAYLLLGEIESNLGDHRSAIDRYEAVIESDEDSPIAMTALAKTGWAQLQQNEIDLAIETFSLLLKVAPESELAIEGLVGRASAFRQAGDFAAAKNDAQRYINGETNIAKRELVSYELGLAQAGLKDWNGAVSTFDDLLQRYPTSERADQYHYEMAWAARSSEDSVTATEHFAAIAANWPDSEFASEANFHVAQAAFDNDELETAARYFQKCTEQTEDLEIKEKALHKLAWSQFKQNKFAVAVSTFREQLTEFPNGPLHAAGRFMVSKSLYEADKFSEALSEYKAAKPAIDAAATISSDFKFLTYLHGAQSANLANEHQQAIQFANALLAPETIQDIDIGLQQQAAMELGDAFRALEKWDEAIAAYADAAKHPGKTGARSMAMIGEIYIDKKDYALAIDKYKLVWYGYGGLDADETVKPWQAFANYQAARCNLFLATASPIDSEATRQYLERAKKRLEFLVINYPEDRLVENAQNQLLQLQ